MTGSAVSEAALAAHEARLCVVPPMQDGSKMPDGAWKEFQQRLSSRSEIVAWYADTDRTGLGVVTGHVSGDLEVLDFDDEPTYLAFRRRAEETGLLPLLERLEACYSEMTPKGGRHVLYRCPVIAGNQKLAKRPKRPEERRHERDLVATLIETRGEGGYIVLAPSHGGVHPSGRPYAQLAGSFATIATINPDERESILDLARSFDEMPKESGVVPPNVPPKMANASFNPVTWAGEDPRPGSDFNRRATWEEILGSEGWTAVYESGGVTYWRRPGKAVGVSATTNYGGSDLLYVFTTSSVFDSEKSYSKFAARAVLCHGGDFSAAASDLSASGYGRPGEPSPVLLSKLTEAISELPDDRATWVWIGCAAARKGVAEVARAWAADPAAFDEGVAVASARKFVPRPTQDERILRRVERALIALAREPKVREKDEFGVKIVKVVRRTAGRTRGGLLDLEVATPRSTALLTALDGKTASNYALVRARALEEGLALPLWKGANGYWAGLLEEALPLAETVPLLAGHELVVVVEDTIRRLLRELPRGTELAEADQGKVVLQDNRLLVKPDVLRKAVVSALPDDKVDRSAWGDAAQRLGGVDARPRLGGWKLTLLSFPASLTEDGDEGAGAGGAA